MISSTILICLEASRFAPRDSSCLSDMSCLIVNEDMPKAPLLPKPFVSTVDNMINLTAVWSLKIVGRIRSRKYKSSLRPRLFPSSPRCASCALLAVQAPFPCIISQNMVLFAFNGIGPAFGHWGSMQFCPIPWEIFCGQRYVLHTITYAVLGRHAFLTHWAVGGVCVPSGLVVFNDN